MKRRNCFSDNIWYLFLLYPFITAQIITGSISINRVYIEPLVETIGQCCNPEFGYNIATDDVDTMHRKLHGFRMQGSKTYDMDHYINAVMQERCDSFQWLSIASPEMMHVYV